MLSTFRPCIVILAVSLPLLAQNSKPQNAPKNGGDFSNTVQPGAKVPKGVILVKGAWSSASDSATPVPEGGNVANNIFSNPYFGMTYPVPSTWPEKNNEPPPSARRPSVLTQTTPGSHSRGESA